MTNNNSICRIETQRRKVGSNPVIVLNVEKYLFEKMCNVGGMIDLCCLMKKN